MKITWRSEWPHWVLLALQFSLAALTWGSAPDRIPVHWGLDGQVDRYGGRVEGLLAMPLVSLGLYLLLLWLPRLDPGRANYPAFAAAYGTMRLALLALMAAIYGVVQLAVHGRPVSVVEVMPLMIGALYIVVGAVLGKIRPNWFVGIRTPWTLSSKVAWMRTHRVGGWLFIAMGVLTVAVAVVHAQWGMWVMIASPIIAGIGLAVYSYRVWRADPEKLPPAGTLPAANG
jgi:immunity protein, SdpI family